MTKEQEILLEIKIYSILKSSNAIGVKLDDNIYLNIISYYKNLVLEVGFDRVIDYLNKVRNIITTSTIGPILESMINNAKRKQKLKTN